MIDPIYPMLLTPAYQHYIWGGSRIPERYARSLPPGRYAESWEVSDRSEGMTLVENGPLAGLPLDMVNRRLGPALTGAPADLPRPFPLLIKIIDARERLSVQVHPYRTGMPEPGAEAKTEMWYILDAPPGARIYAGLRPGSTRQSLLDALQTGAVEDSLRACPVSPGDAVFIPGGRLHAIGEGCLILEVQQNSNTTYRVHDWGRLDDQGKPRPLHIDQALRVIDMEDHGNPLVCPRLTEAREGVWSEILVRCPWFTVGRTRIARALTLHPGMCRALFAAEGGLTVAWEDESLHVPAGRTCLVPARSAPCTLAPDSPSCTVISAQPA